MRHYIGPALLGVLTATTFSFAQPGYRPGPYDRPPRGMSQQEAADIAHYWVKSYLRRRASPDEVRYWADQLRNARSPADALSALLGGREYYDYSGGTPEGLVAQLIRDVGHHEPRREEVLDYLRRTRGVRGRDLAYRFLRENPANWWPGPEATPPPEFGGGDPGYDPDRPPPRYWR